MKDVWLDGQTYPPQLLQVSPTGAAVITSVASLLSKDVQSQNSPAPVKELALDSYTILTVYKATPKSVEPRQESETWRAFERLDLPAGDSAFIWKSLWKKLAVRTRLTNMLAIGVHCPFNSSTESIYHSTKACTYLQPLFLIVRSLLGVVYRKTGVIEPSRLMADHPMDSLTTLQGVLIWVGARVLWGARRDSIFRDEKVTQNDYLAKFYAALAPYTAGDSQYSIPPGLAEGTREAVKGYLSGGRLPLRQPCPKLNFNNTGQRGSDRKKDWIKGHLDMYMAAREEAVGPLVKEGYVVVWTDGAKEVRLGVHVAGAGVYFGQGGSRNLSEPLPYGEQTNNRAELWAFIQSLRKTSPQEKVL